MIIYTPIPAAQRHTVDELLACLPNDSASVVEIDAEGRSGFAKVRALIRHIWIARALGRRSQTTVFVTWPLLGWLDLILWTRPRRAQPVYVAVHDPVPLRTQIGLGRRSEALARWLTRFGHVQIVCHSEAAAREVRSRFPHLAVALLPHPFMADPAPRRQSNVVLVLGQYKAARDLDLLERVGPRLQQQGFQPRILGRGWPDTNGWSVGDRFLSEEEFRDELVGCGALLVPYRYYFQSGVALQALELGVPIVGVPTDFLVALVGSDYPGLVLEDSDDGWIEAIGRAVGIREDADRLRGIHDRIARSWRDWHSAVTLG